MTISSVRNLFVYLIWFKPEEIAVLKKKKKNNNLEMNEAKTIQTKLMSHENQQPSSITITLFYD